MLELPDVTLVAIDTICHDLVRMALEDSSRGIKFGDCLIFSDSWKASAGGLGKFIETYITSKDEFGKFLWYALSYHVKTSHVLVIQWDGFVVNPQVWDNRFLDYDYIGAPWWYDAMTVGNGGFSLRSTRLLKHLASAPSKYQYSAPEDRALCRNHSAALRSHGFKFADVSLASKFSFESIVDADVTTFGFHGARNFPYVLTEKRLNERIEAFNVYAEQDLPLLNEAKERILKDGKMLGYLNRSENASVSV